MSREVILGIEQAELGIDSISPAALLCTVVSIESSSVIKAIPIWAVITNFWRHEKGSIGSCFVTKLLIGIKFR